MKISKVLSLCALLLLLFAVSCATANSSSLERIQALAKEDSSGCLICTAIVGIAKNVGADQSAFISKEAQKLCDILDEKTRPVCSLIVEMGVSEIEKLLLQSVTPGKVCSTLGLCKNCKLGSTHVQASSPQTQLKTEDENLWAAYNVAMVLGLSKRISGIHSSNETVSDVSSRAGGFMDTQTAWPDVDGDGFGALPLYRGSDWRGRDCNDFSKKVRPGLNEFSMAVKLDIAEDAANHTDANAWSLVDYDCNGVPHRLENKLCANSEVKQIVMFGDSASSAFSLPVSWLHLKDMGSIPHEFLLEFDVPQTSYSTGRTDDIDGKSIYLRMLARNRCNHRQIANVGKNGAEMKDLVHQVELLGLDQTRDKPILGFMAYVGNDVCEASLDEMTPVEEFRQQYIDGLRKLDSVAPPGSKLLSMGLVDGRILYDTMSQLPHPLGGTVAEFYEFLTCVGSNPCGTWLTSDVDTRNKASAHAALLSQTVAEVVQSTAGTFKNIEVAYFDFPLEQAFELLHRDNLPAKDLIGGVDCFHPSVPLAHKYLGEVIWEELETQHPSWLGSVNPNNAEIDRLFGNQGGY
eukprot:ANDGO_07579.mRNA.1 acyloxyacyl hydrolase-like protein